MKLSLPGFVVAALCFAATACGPSIDTQVDYNPEHDFQGVWSYAWLPPPEASGPANEPASQFFDDRMRAVVDRHLAAKGLVVYVDNPSFLIGYTALVEREVTWVYVNDYYSRWPAYGYHGGGWGSALRPTVISQGSLVIDLLDPETGYLIWRGVAEADVSRDRTGEERAQRLDDAVRMLLEDFPPP